VQRDVRTVARWEKERGLPVHRVPGVRGQIFAFEDEIDAWLMGQSRETVENPSPGEAEPAPVPRGGARSRIPAFRARVLMPLIAAACLAAVVLAAAAPRWWSDPPPVTVTASGQDLVATTAGGAEVWRHGFDAPVVVGPADERISLSDLDADGQPELLAVVGQRKDWPEDDALYVFSLRGRLLWQHRRSDAVEFRDGRFEAPWSSGPLYVFDTGGTPSILWLTHHHTWWPSIAVRLDAAGHERGRFVHAGWLTSARSLGDGRLLLGGVSNEHDADVLMVLDDRSWDGSGPSTTGTPFECAGCPEGRPAEYFVLPRTEYSRVSGARRQPARIRVYESTVEVRIAQNEEGEPPELIVEFTPALGLRALRVSDSYWTWHRRLEAAGHLAHTRDGCPDRQLPEVLVWKRERGWLRATPARAH